MLAIKRFQDLAPTISVGVLTANLMQLEADLARLNDTDVGILHFDVMDGCFSPMMTVGPPFIKQVTTPLLKDVHLMIDDPLEKVEDYVKAGADLVTVHMESTIHIHRVLQKLGSLTNANDPARGIVRGVALNPGTPASTLEPLMDDLEMIVLLAINPGWGGQSFIASTYQKVRKVQEMIAESGRSIQICIDGGITKANIAEVAKSGVELVVTGSAVFDGKSPTENANFMLDTLRSEWQERTF